MSTLYYESSAHKDFLSHHGILGQKWGKRNGPPYPLDASDHSASENKAGWRKSLKGGGASVTKNKNLSTDSSNKISVEKQKLSDNQKKTIAVGTAAVATALAVVGTAHLVKSGKFDVAIKAGKKITKKTILKGKKAVDKVISKTTHGKFMNMPEKEIAAYIDKMSMVKKSIELNDTVNHPLRGRAKKIVAKTLETAATGASAYMVGSIVDKRIDKNQLGDYMRRGGAKKK